jgi:DNA-binding phage protein
MDPRSDQKMRSIGAGPWSAIQLLASDAMAWAVREAKQEAQGIPAAIYLDRLAEHAGLTRKQLFRILGGETSPTVEVLARLCRAISSNRAAAALAEECGLVVVGGLLAPLEAGASLSRAGAEGKNG